jgi:hypothetical protein
MLKIPVEYDRDTSSATFKDISRQLQDLLLGVSVAAKELWWMNQEWLDSDGDAQYIRKSPQCVGRFVWYHPVTVTSNQ